MSPHLPLKLSYVLVQVERFVFFFRASPIFFFDRFFRATFNCRFLHPRNSDVIPGGRRYLLIKEKFNGD
jgi:hypothetical protein